MEMKNNDLEISGVILDFQTFKEFSKSLNFNIIVKVWRGIGVGYVGLFGLFFLFMTAFGVSDPSRVNHENLLSWDLISRLSGFLFMVFFLFIVPWFIYPGAVSRGLKKSYENNKLMQRSQNYMFNEFGLEIKSEIGQSRFQWEDLTAVKETNVYLALYISKYQAFIIPKRFLENRIDIIRHIKSKVPAKYSVVKQGLQIS